MNDIPTKQRSEISVESSSAQTVTSATVQGARINAVEDKMKSLEGKASKLGAEFRRLEKQSDRLGNFVIAVTTGVLIALAIILIPMGVDYFKNSWERYETLKEMILNMRSEIQLLNYRIDTLDRGK